MRETQSSFGRPLPPQSSSRAQRQTTCKNMSKNHMEWDSGWESNLHQLQHMPTVIPYHQTTSESEQQKSHHYSKQVSANESILLQVCTQSVRGSHHQTLEESCCLCRTQQNAVSVPPQSNSRAQKHEKTVDSGSSLCSLFCQTTHTNLRKPSTVKQNHDRSNWYCRSPTTKIYC